MIALIVVLVAALAAANGANDVPKGVATLAGAGVASYRAAIAWDGEGLRANLTLSVLVGLGANRGLPMSTTHVATGAIAGACGGRLGRLNRRTLRELAVAWLATAPVAAAPVAGSVAAASFLVLR